MNNGEIQVKYSKNYFYIIILKKDIFYFYFRCNIVTKIKSITSKQFIPASTLELLATQFFYFWTHRHWILNLILIPMTRSRNHLEL
jgi:hypothetical protein